MRGSASRGAASLAVVTLLAIPATGLADDSSLAGSTGYDGSDSTTLSTAQDEQVEGGELTFHDEVVGDVSSFGVGHLRDMDQHGGDPAGATTIEVSGVGQVKRALLYWHGPTNSPEATAHDTLTFAGEQITGDQIGFADDNCWGYDNSQVVVDGTTVLPQGAHNFDGDTVQHGGGTAPTNGGLWDIRTLDVTGVVDDDEIQVTSPVYRDCLSLVAALVRSDPGPWTVGPSTRQRVAYPDGQHAITVTKFPDAPDGPVVMEVVDGPHAGQTDVCDPDAPDSPWMGWALPLCHGTLFGSNQFTVTIDQDLDPEAAAGTDTARVWIDADRDGHPGFDERVAQVTVTWLEPTDYVALGDSYSSGDGATPYLPGSRDADGKVCDRSERAYSTFVTIPQVASDPPQMSTSVPGTLRSTAEDGDAGSWTFRACAGAQTWNMYAGDDPGDVFDPDPRDQYPDEPRQVLHLSDQTDLVTYTIGGNDTGFAPVLTYCAKYDAVHVSSCSTSDQQRDEFGGLTVAQYIDQQLSSLPAKVDAVHGQVVDRAANATVVVPSYPRLFATDTDGSCTFPWDLDTTDWFNSLAENLSARLETAAAAAGVHFVDVQPHFATREYCGSGSSFFFGLRRDGPMHPNYDGHRLGYGAAINEYLEDLIARGAPLGPTGLPLNPGATASVSASEEPAAAGSTVPTLAQATVDAPDAPADACPDVTPTGTDIVISAEGFDPASEVTLGVGLNNEPVTTVTAGTSGVAQASTTTTATDDGVQLWWLSGTDPDGGAVHALASTVIEGTTWSTCDVDGPTITVHAPTAGTYDVGDRVTVAYECSDPSGVAECHGTLGNGSLLPTSEPGIHQLTIFGTDTLGNTSEVSVVYQVGTRAGRTLDEWGDPLVEPHDVNVVRAGRTVPVRFRVLDLDGVPSDDPDGLRVATAPRDCSFAGDTGSLVEPEDAGHSGLRSLGDGWWQFGWDTSRTLAGTCWTFTVMLDGQTRHDLWFQFE